MSDGLLESMVERVRTQFHVGDECVADKAAESTNVGLVQHMVRALACGDYATFENHLHPEAEFIIVGPPQVPFLGRWKGRQAVAQAVQSNFAQVEQEMVEIENVTAQGDTVVMFGRERGRYRGGLP